MLRRSEFDVDTSEGSVYRRFENRFEAGSSDTGFDGLAIDRNDNLVVVETKATGKTGRIDASILGEADGNKQLSEAYIENEFQNLADDAVGNPERVSFLRELKQRGYIDADFITEDGEIVDIQVNGIERDRIRTQLIVIQDGRQTGELVSPALRQDGESTPSIDRVIQVKLGSTFDVPESSSAELSNAWSTGVEEPMPELLVGASVSGPEEPTYRTSVT